MSSCFEDPLLSPEHHHSCGTFRLVFCFRPGPRRGECATGGETFSPNPSWTLTSRWIPNLTFPPHVGVGPVSKISPSPKVSPSLLFRTFPAFPVDEVLDYPRPPKMTRRSWKRRGTVFLFRINDVRAQLWVPRASRRPRLSLPLRTKRAGRLLRAPPPATTFLLFFCFGKPPWLLFGFSPCISNPS